MQEAATYDDVDAVVLTGMSHTVTPALGDVSFYPGEPRSALRGARLPGRLFHHRPRNPVRSIFYNTATRPPRSPHHQDRREEQGDDHHRRAQHGGPRPGLLDRSPRSGAGGGRGQGPGLLQPAGLHGFRQHRDEPGFYPAAACAEAVAIPGAGHDLNLHYQAPRTYTTLLKWLNQRIGSNTKFPAPHPCS